MRSQTAIMKIIGWAKDNNALQVKIGDVEITFAPKVIPDTLNRAEAEYSRPADDPDYWLSFTPPNPRLGT